MTIWEKLKAATNFNEAGAILEAALSGTCPPPWDRKCIGDDEDGGCAKCWANWLDSEPCESEGVGVTMMSDK